MYEEFGVKWTVTAVEVTLPNTGSHGGGSRYQEYGREGRTTIRGKFDVEGVAAKPRNHDAEIVAGGVHNSCVVADRVSDGAEEPDVGDPRFEVGPCQVGGISWIGVDRIQPIGGRVRAAIGFKKRVAEESAVEVERTQDDIGVRNPCQ